MRRFNLAANKRVPVALLLAFTTLLAVATFTSAAPAPLRNPPATPAAQEPVTATLAGEVARDGNAVSTDNVRVQPGEVITWKLALKNNSRQPKSDLKADSPVPQGTEFVPGSVSADGANVLYSIDGGRTFSERPMVRVVKNGLPRDIPAAPSIYTTVRFVWDGSLPPGEARHAAYKTRVR